MLRENIDVSVVIPTRNRPDLVKHAALSALGQSVSRIEVLVVVDGPDEETVSTLKQIPDERLIVLALEQSVGGSEARNFGARQAKGRWVAFLDDDDEWFSEKLAKQLLLVEKAQKRYPVVACRLVAKGPTECFVWPKRLPGSGEFVGDYLFNRTSLFQGETLLQTSMLLAPRDLMLIVPFRKLPRHQEWDWLLRASELAEFELLFEPTPQMIWNIDENRARISTRNKSDEWEFSLSWIAGYRHRISRSSYANFLLTVVADLAGRSSDKSAFRTIIIEALRNGRPNVWTIGSFIAIRLFPKETRHKIRHLLGKCKRGRAWQRWSR